MEAIGIFINQSPGCRQRTILAPKPAAWLLLPGSGALALGHFGWGQRRPSHCETLTTTTPRPRSGGERAERG